MCESAPANISCMGRTTRGASIFALKDSCSNVRIPACLVACSQRVAVVQSLQRNVHRAAGVGLHAVRRFRTETVRRAGVPEDLIDLWIGHAPRSVTDLYANGLKNDHAWRREWSDKVGLGFSVGLYRASNEVSLVLEQAA